MLETACNQPVEPVAPSLDCFSGEQQAEGPDSQLASHSTAGDARTPVEGGIGSSTETHPALGSAVESLPCGDPEDAASMPEEPLIIRENDGTWNDANLLPGDEFELLSANGGPTEMLSRASRPWYRRAARKARTCCSKAWRLFHTCFGCQSV
jgi:hypothetical protein